MTAEVFIEGLIVWLCCMLCYALIAKVFDEYPKKARWDGEGWLLSGILMASVFVWSLAGYRSIERKLDALKKQVEEQVGPVQIEDENE